MVDLYGITEAGLIAWRPDDGPHRLLPLLRYRTGDDARLSVVDGSPALVDLEGRDPVRYQ